MGGKIQWFSSVHIYISSFEKTLYTFEYGPIVYLWVDMLKLHKFFVARDWLLNFWLFLYWLIILGSLSDNSVSSFHLDFRIIILNLVDSLQRALQLLVVEHGWTDISDAML